MENKYAVKLLPRAYRDLDSIYAYIAETLMEPGIASKLVDFLEESIFSLERMPQRGVLRKKGLMPTGDIARFSKVISQFCTVLTKQKRKSSLSQYVIQKANSEK